MELIEIHMVCPQVFQGDFQILSEFLPSFCGCLGCDKHLVTYSLKGGSQLFLTVRIIPGCVKERDSAFICLFYQVYGILLRYSLDGMKASQLYGLARVLLLVFVFEDVIPAVLDRKSVV